MTSLFSSGPAQSPFMPFPICRHRQVQLPVLAIQALFFLVFRVVIAVLIEDVGNNGICRLTQLV